MPEPISLNPLNGFQNTIESLCASTKLPPLSDAELSSLDFHSVGPVVVGEALREKPISGVDQRSLSRYATKIALERMSKCTPLQELQKYRCEYLEAKKWLVLRVRKRCDDLLWSLACGYIPFVTARSVHIWFWDGETRNAVFSICSDAGVPKRVIYAFVADALSEIGSLGEAANDLKDEYDQAMICLGVFSASVKRMVLDINHE